MTTTVDTADGLRALRPGAILRDRAGDLLIKDANGDFACVTSNVETLTGLSAGEVAGEYAEDGVSAFLPAQVVVS